MKKQVKEETPDLSFHSGFVLLQVLHLPGTHPFIHLSIPPLIHPAIHHAFPFHGMKEHRQLHKIGLLKWALTLASYSPNHPTSLASLSPWVNREDWPMRSLKACLLWCSKIWGTSEQFGSPYLSYLTCIPLDKHGNYCSLFPTTSFIPDCPGKGTHTR